MRVNSDIRLNSEELALEICGKSVPLSRKEYRIMDLFMRHEGLVLNKETLFGHLYRAPFPADKRIIDVYVCRLRKKFGSAGLEESIRTVWGKGYCFDPGEVVDS